MSVRIYYGTKINIALEDRPKFEHFIKLCAIANLRHLLKQKKEYLSPLFSLLDLSSNDIYKNLNNIIEVRSLTYSFILGFKPNIITTKLNMIDYGSELTGLPRLMFNNIFYHIKKHIVEYYLRYLGVIVS